MANQLEKDKVQTTATQSDSTQTAPNADDFQAWGIDVSPSENVAVQPTPKQETPPSEPAVQPEQPIVAEPTMEVPKKFLDKFESAEDLENYARQIEKERTSFETENQMVRKMLDKYLESLQTGVPQQTGTTDQRPVVPVSQQVASDFDIPDDLTDEILNKDFKGGMKKLLGKYSEHLERTAAPRLLGAVEQRQMYSIAQQQAMKNVHDNFYSTYGERIQSVLPDNGKIEDAKPVVGMAFNNIYHSLPRNLQAQIDQNPVLIFPKVADEAVKMISKWSGKGNGKPITETPKAPVLSGSGSRPSPKKDTSKPITMTTADGRPAELNDPGMIDWFYKNKV